VSKEKKIEWREGERGKRDEINRRER